MPPFIFLLPIIASSVCSLLTFGSIVHFQLLSARRTISSLFVQGPIVCEVPLFRYAYPRFGKVTDTADRGSPLEHCNLPLSRCGIGPCSPTDPRLASGFGPSGSSHPLIVWIFPLLVGILPRNGSVYPPEQGWTLALVENSVLHLLHQTMYFAASSRYVHFTTRRSP